MTVEVGVFVAIAAAGVWVGGLGVAVGGRGVAVAGMGVTVAGMGEIVAVSEGVRVKVGLAVLVRVGGRKGV